MNGTKPHNISEGEGYEDDKSVELRDTEPEVDSDATVEVPESTLPMRRLPPLELDDAGGAHHRPENGWLPPAKLPPIGAPASPAPAEDGVGTLASPAKPTAVTKPTRPPKSAASAANATGCSRYFNSAKYLLFCLCLCSITQGFLINGIVSVSITTLEKRFHLTSTQSGLFGSMYDIAVCLVLFPVCHFGGKGHKGRWLAIGMMIMGCGSIVCVLPQFFTPNMSNNSTNERFCIPSRRSNYYNETMESCSGNGTTARGSLMAYLILLGGQALHGIGAAPIYTLGITYLDENVAQQSSPLYMAIFLGSSVLGPAIGYLSGGFLLQLDGSLLRQRNNSTVITSEYAMNDWYGAWWIGYIIAAVMAFIAAIPLLMFPRTLPSAIALRKQDINQAHANNDSELDDVAMQVGFGDNFQEFKKSVKRFLRNPTFLLLLTVDCLEALISTGVVMYLPKIVENFFSKSASTASLITGMMAIPAAFVGNLLGGYISRRFQLKCAGMIFLALVVNIGCFCLMTVFLARCPPANFAGVNVPYPQENSTGSLRSTCNNNCGCASTSSVYAPVCHRESQTQFYSACFAGCKGKSREGSNPNVGVGLLVTFAMRKLTNVFGRAVVCCRLSPNVLENYQSDRDE